jgi:hypothetical protein
MNERLIVCFLAQKFHAYLFFNRYGPFSRKVPTFLKKGPYLLKKGL